MTGAAPCAPPVINPGKLMPRLGLVEEFAAFRREMEEVLAAAEIGDWETIGHIRRAHISMSFRRMMKYAGGSTAEPGTVAMRAGD